MVLRPGALQDLWCSGFFGGDLKVLCEIAQGPSRPSGENMGKIISRMAIWETGIMIIRNFQQFCRGRSPKS